MGFTHLHVHTQYSILDGASSIPALMKKAKEDEMKAIAITDHGNLYGAKEFYNEEMAKKQAAAKKSSPTPKAPPAAEMRMDSIST